MNNRDLSFPKKLGLALWMGMILQLSAFAQCTGNMATRTYDTALVSNGFNIFSLSFPKFSPDSGILVSVKMAATVSSQYGFTLRNADTQPSTYNLAVGQEDQFISPQLLSPFTNITDPQAIGSYPLTPGQSFSQPPFTFLDHHVSSDSITGVGPFLGADKVSVSYMSFTYTNLSTFNNASYYYSASIANTMHFSLQYLYCKTSIVLATDLTRWEARLQQPRTVQLGWSVTGEVAGRQYYIQRSSDGKAFIDIKTLAAGGVADYSWSDLLPAGASGNFYYRLAIDDNGSLSYSPVRQISLASDNREIAIYPNPATDFINLSTGQQSGDWQVDIFSANGSLIQRETFLQVSKMHIQLHFGMSAGTYFVRATDLRGQRSFTSSFILSGAN